MNYYIAVAAKATILSPERSVTRDSAIAEISARRHLSKTLGKSALPANIAAVLDIVRLQAAALLARQDTR